MKAKFLYLLEELNDNYSDEILEELIHCYKEELIIEELFQENERTISALNDAPIEFIEFLASEIVSDFDQFPEIYFLSYEEFFSFFSEQKLNQLYNIAIEKANDEENGFYFVNGLKYLLNSSPEIALFYFNQIDNYVSEYFISACYQELDNYENSIKSAEKFLKEFNKTCEKEIENSDGSTTKFGELNSVVFSKWNTLNDLAYCYIRVKNYSKALKTYKISLELISLEDNYNINNNPNARNGEFDDFTIFVYNYLLALEKNGKFNECIKTIDFVISKYPKISFFRKQRKLYQKKLDDAKYTNSLIDNPLKPKKSFVLGKYEKTKILSKEKSLEDMIIEQIKHGFNVFNKRLEIYEDENIFGRQYYISSVNGFLDLLLIDKENDIIYVVELKRNEAGKEVVEQTEKYITGLRNEINKEIRGIICLHKPKKELIDLVKIKQNLELYTYNFEFKKVE